jgi:GNAT superfamily N-acetyltransferase
MSVKIEVLDKGTLGGHLHRLDDDDRRVRFGETDDYIIDAYVMRLRLANENIRARDIVFGWRDEMGVVRAAIHANSEGTTVEIALTVEKGFRGRGIGTALFDRVLKWATDVGMKRLRSECLAQSHWMTHRLKALGYSVEQDGAAAVACLAKANREPAAQHDHAARPSSRNRSFPNSAWPRRYGSWKAVY